MSFGVALLDGTTVISSSYFIDSEAGILDLSVVYLIMRIDSSARPLSVDWSMACSLGARSSFGRVMSSMVDITCFVVVFDCFLASFL